MLLLFKALFPENIISLLSVKTTTSSNLDNIDRFEGKLLQELTKRKCKNIVKLYGMYETQISDT